MSPESAIYNDIEIVQDMNVFHKLTENGTSILVFLWSYESLLVQ